MKFNNAFVFPDPKPPFLIFCMDDLEYAATLDYNLFFFNCYNHQN